MTACSCSVGHLHAPAEYARPLQAFQSTNGRVQQNIALTLCRAPRRRKRWAERSAEGGAQPSQGAGCPAARHKKPRAAACSGCAEATVGERWCCRWRSHHANSATAKTGADADAARAKAALSGGQLCWDATAVWPPNPDLGSIAAAAECTTVCERLPRTAAERGAVCRGPPRRPATAPLEGWKRAGQGGCTTRSPAGAQRRRCCATSRAPGQRWHGCNRLQCSAGCAWPRGCASPAAAIRRLSAARRSAGKTWHTSVRWPLFKSGLSHPQVTDNVLTARQQGLARRGKALCSTASGDSLRVRHLAPDHNCSAFRRCVPLSRRSSCTSGGHTLLHTLPLACRCSRGWRPT